MVKRISREALHTDIRRVGDEIGDRPTENAYRERGEYSIQTVYDRFGSWNAALEAAGYPARTGSTVPSKTALREELQVLADRLSNPPTADDMNAFGRYWGSQYCDQFGSWTAALNAVDLELPTDPPQTPAALEESLRELAADPKSANPPTKHDMATRGRYHPRAYIDEYGTWAGALRAAGLDRREAAPETALINELQRLATRLGYAPSGVKMNAHGAYQRSTYQERFGSWSEALETAGLPADIKERGQDRDGGPNPRIKRKELLTALESLAQELGRPPMAKEMRADGPYSDKTYRRMFDSWSEALEAADLPADIKERGRDRDGGPYPLIKREELLTALESLAQELGRPPMAKEMRADGPYSDTMYRRTFGSWNEALEAAGIANDHNPNKLSESVLIHDLRVFADNLGKRPTAHEMNTEGPYATSTYQDHFGSWNDAVETALADWTPPANN